MCVVSLQENISRLESVNIKLRKEKIDLVKEISTVKQEAHQEILRAEAALNKKIKVLNSQAKELKEQLTTTRKAHEEAATELASAQETMRQDAGAIAEVLYTSPLLHTTLFQVYVLFLRPREYNFSIILGSMGYSPWN